MSLSLAALLGLIQGLTEFLPVSSTAHLRILPALLGLADPGAAFTAVIQLGTLAAVLIYFARDLFAIGRATLARAPELLRLRLPAIDLAAESATRETAAIGGSTSEPTAGASGESRSAIEGSLAEARHARLGAFIILGTIPVGIVGLLFRHAVEHDLRSLYVIAASLVLLALVLLAAERLTDKRRLLDTLTLRDALVIGGAQALAIIPGVSRSGVTLTAALFTGLRREDAARYSFLLSVPAVGAAGVFELHHALVGSKGGLAQAAVPLLVATLVAGVVGYGCIAWFLRYLRTRTTLVFVVWRAALGLLLFGLLLGGRLAAS